MKIYLRCEGYDSKDPLIDMNWFDGTFFFAVWRFYVYIRFREYTALNLTAVDGKEDKR